MLRTLARVLIGFVLACLTAGLVQVLFVETPKELASAPAGELAGQASNTLMLTFVAATQFAVFSAAFALIAAGIAEWLSLRSPAYWLTAGTGIALLGFIAQYASEVAGQPSIFNNYALQAYLTAGFFGGLVYWLVAGSHSGSSHTHEPLVETAQPAPRPRIIVEKSERAEVKKGSLAEKLALKRSKEKAAAGPQQDAEGESAPAAATSATVESGKPPSAGTATAVPVTKAQPVAAKNPPPAQAKPSAPGPQET